MRRAGSNVHGMASGRTATRPRYWLRSAPAERGPWGSPVGGLDAAATAGPRADGVGRGPPAQLDRGPSDRTSSVLGVVGTGADPGLEPGARERGRPGSRP